MKNKSQYEKELEYQIELMRAIDSQSTVRELAASLVEYGRLATAGKPSRAAKDNLIGGIASLAADKWFYIRELLKANLPSEAAQSIQELCEARFPFL
jgi:hypothetical protein